MNRTIKRAAVALTVLGLSCLPGTALADARRSAPVIIIGDGNQVAGTNIFNADHDNIIGDDDGDTAVPPDQESAGIEIEATEPVNLVSHTGDATFPDSLFASSSFVRFSERSTATYRGPNTDYDVVLFLDKDGNPDASCQPTAPTGQCTIDRGGPDPVVIMGFIK
ncbi:hypothetical protein [Streptacidiphilus sp. EB129]|uniref:hypothetical protein n=1 Tax=Streptacidiphilus sp. EB129 TaxID=3156262 RepID=UPI0035184F88